MKKRRICAWLCAAAAILLFCMGATAAELPNQARTGSITVVLTDPQTHEAVAGGTITLYRVGDLAVEAGDIRFTLTEEFAAGDLPLTASAEAAQALRDYAAAHAVPGTAQTVGADGRVVYSDLPLGLYLLVQSDAAAGYLAFNPFLVELPMRVGAGLLYDVTATPKLVADGTPLVQTGQLVWQLLVVAFCGLVLLTAGCLLYRKGKDTLA